MKIDDIKKLQQKKYREQFGCFLVEGEHLVLELEKAAGINPALQSSQLLVTEKYADWQSSFKTSVISDKQMAAISDTKTPQGIIAVAPFLQAKHVKETERAVYLYEIQDPGNLGTILRSLAWFGNFRCLLSPNSVDPYNPKVVRASMGAIFHVPMELDVPMETLPERYSRIAALDMDGKKLSSDEFTQQDCYLFGNEARGVPREILQAWQPATFTIPGSGAIESLNLATAVNICCYELSR